VYNKSYINHLSLLSHQWFTTTHVAAARVVHQVTEHDVGGRDSVYFLMCAFVCVSSNGLDLVTTIATAGTLAAAAVLVWR